MKVTSTLSRQGATTERKLTLPNFVYFGLRDTARTQNKEFSQGKLLYEILHFDRDKPCRDEISEVENFVDRQLSEVLGEQSAAEVDKIKIIDANGQEALSNDVPDDLEPTENSNSPVRVRLPDETWSQIHSEKERYIGEWLTPSLIKFVESPFNSRMERINCKRELVDYLRGEVGVETMESKVAYACVTGDSERFDIGSVHNLIQQETATEWSQNITVDDLREMSSGELQNIGLGQKSKGQRVQAIETAIKNDNSQPEYDEVQELVKEVYGVETTQTARSYVDQMEMEWLGPKVEGVRDLANQIKQEVVEELPEKKTASKRVPKQVGQNMPVYEFLLVDKDKLDNIDRRYDSVEDALEALDDLVEQAHRPERLGKAQDEAHEEFKNQIELLKRFGENGTIGYQNIEGFDGSAV
ncbi:hypothetical protein [Halorussus marinus]|uniref:hypothetical protein n=1 Tax=Halorussus marinus TaxID=2505976 RepID=UPI00106E4284|nr:hypothetical protein [Halorussus marinus]